MATFDCALTEHCYPPATSHDAMQLNM